MIRIVAATSPGLAGAIVWALRLGEADGPWTDGPALLLGSWLVVLATVSLVGMVAGGSRWARRLGIGLGCAHLLIAVILPLSPLWWAGVSLSTLSIAALTGPLTRTWVRSRPGADAPPVQAVGLATLLLVTPALLALAATDGMGTGWVWVAASVSSVLVYARAAPGAVAVVRVLPPVAGVLAVVGSPLAVALASAITSGAVTALAWTTGARVAVRPLIERGRAVPIPPELVPEDVLDAAGLDRRGRRKAGS